MEFIDAWLTASVNVNLIMKLLHIVGDSEFSSSAIVPRLAQMTKQLGWQVDVLPTNQLHGPYRLYRFLRGAGYDIVHTHGSRANWVGLAARLAGTPAILHTAHGFAFDECSHPLVLWFYTLPERLAAGWSDRMIMMSDFHRRWALRLGIGDQRKVISIPNGIPNRRHWDERERLNARSGLGAVPDQVVILVTGRLAADSGVEYLIEAMPALAARL